MTRYARRQDASQEAIVEALRWAGLAVRDLSGAGQGCPDLAVSWGQRTAFVEVKTQGTHYGKRLNDNQVDWCDGWEGIVIVLRTAEEAWDWAATFKALGQQVTR